MTDTDTDTAPKCLGKGDDPWPDHQYGGCEPPPAVRVATNPTITGGCINNDPGVYPGDGILIAAVPLADTDAWARAPREDGLRLIVTRIPAPYPDLVSWYGSLWQLRDPVLDDLTHTTTRYYVFVGDL